jgi:HSP20 family protein
MKAFFEGTGTEEGYPPPVDLYDTGDALVFEIDLPGMAPGDIHIHVFGDILVIEGARREPDEGKALRFICMERGPRKFSRTLRVPVPVDPRLGTAAYRDGVIKVRLPKVVEGPVRIPVEHR